MSEQTSKKEAYSPKDYQKISMTEFINVSKWILGTIYRIDKFNSIVYFIASSLQKVTGIVWAYIFAKILDWVIKMTSGNRMPNSDEVLTLLLVLSGFSVFETLITFARNYSSNTLRIYGRPAVRKFFLEKLNFLGIQTLEQPNVNDKIYRTQERLAEIVPHYFSLVDFLTEIAALIWVAVIIIRVQPIAAFAVLLLTIPYMVFDKKMRVKWYSFEFENTERSRQSFSNALQLGAPTSLPEIYIIGGFNYLLNKYWNFQMWYVGVLYKLNKLWRIGSHSFGFINDLVSYLFYINIFLQAINKKITIGDITFIIRAMERFRTSLSTLTRTFSDVMETSLRFKDITSLFEMTPLFADGSIELGKLKNGPAITISKLDFAYPNSEKKIFENLNLHINAGEKIAIVGHNGAGKTTLAKLISRFYKIETGQILINDININDIQSESLYRNLGVLWQDYNTYAHLSVKDNVYIGNSQEEFNEEAFNKSLEAADALAFINEYPHKLETILSERYKDGIRPSTGQWQKIALARFFYRNAPLIIFDEPTASIDAKSEYNIFKNIYNFFTGKTVIIISHRFSTVRNADRIIVMDHGKIVEEGSHDILLEKNGMYAQAFRLQAEGYKETVNEIVEK